MRVKYFLSRLIDLMIQDSAVLGGLFFFKSSKYCGIMNGNKYYSIKTGDDYEFSEIDMDLYKEIFPEITDEEADEEGHEASPTQVLLCDGHRRATRRGKFRWQAGGGLSF